MTTNSTERPLPGLALAPVGGPPAHRVPESMTPGPTMPLDTTPTEPQLPSTSPATRAALTLLILGVCLLVASTWRVYSNTWDEPEHLAAGIELLDRGKYEYDTEHPPLVRALMALGPYLAGAHSFGTPPPDGVQEGVDILYAVGHYDLYLTLARLGTLPFLAVLLYATWLWARRLTASRSEALLAVALVASVPPILGHAGLATLDVPAAATTLLALYAMQSWLSTARWRDAVFFGIAAGVAVGSKFSAIPFLGLGFVVLVLAQVVLRWRTEAQFGVGRKPIPAAAGGSHNRRAPWSGWGRCLPLAGDSWRDSLL